MHFALRWGWQWLYFNQVGCKSLSQESVGASPAVLPEAFKYIQRKRGRNPALGISLGVCNYRRHLEHRKICHCCPTWQIQIQDIPIYEQKPGLPTLQKVQEDKYKNGGLLSIRLKTEQRMWQKLSKSTSLNPKSLGNDSNEKIPLSLYVAFEEKTNWSGF